MKCNKLRKQGIKSLLRVIISKIGGSIRRAVLTIVFTVILNQPVGYIAYRFELFQSHIIFAYKLNRNDCNFTICLRWSINYEGMLLLIQKKIDSFFLKKDSWWNKNSQIQHEITEKFTPKIQSPITNYRSVISRTKVQRGFKSWNKCTETTKATLEQR